MAGFMDKMEKIAKEGIAKGSDLIEEGKAKAEILAKEKGIKDAMIKIGQYYYKKGEVDPEVAKLAEDIKKAEAEIAQLKKI